MPHSLHLYGNQLVGVDELGDPRLRVLGGKMEVLAKLFLCRDTVRAGRDPDQLPLGVVSTCAGVGLVSAIARSLNHCT